MIQNKFMTFKHTKDGMLYVPGEINEFILAKELNEFLYEQIRTANNMLDYNKKSEDDFSKNQVYTYERIIETLKMIQKMI